MARSQDQPWKQGNGKRERGVEEGRKLEKEGSNE